MADGWRLDIMQPEGFTVEIAKHFGVSLLELRYQWGGAQAVWLADPHDRSVWHNIEAWAKAGKANLVCFCVEGLAVQEPLFKGPLDELRALSAKAAESGELQLFACMAHLMETGHFRSARRSIIADCAVEAVEVAAITTPKLRAGMAAYERVLLPSGKSALSLVS